MLLPCLVPKVRLAAQRKHGILGLVAVFREGQREKRKGLMTGGGGKRDGGDAGGREGLWHELSGIGTCSEVEAESWKEA